MLTQLTRTVVRSLHTSPSSGILTELVRLLPELGTAPPMATDIDRARF